MTTKLGEIFSDVRSQYLTHFADCVAKISKEKRAIIEAAFRNKHGGLVKEGSLNLPLRGDIFVITEGRPTESFSVNSKSLLKFQSFAFIWGNNLLVQVNPFFWDACDLRLVTDELPANWQQLKNWFFKWFDEEDKNQLDEQGFNGVIHFLSDPACNGSILTLQMDLGSAPMQALEDLLNVLLNLGIKEVKIGQVS